VVAVVFAFHFGRRIVIGIKVDVAVVICLNSNSKSYQQLLTASW